MTEVAEGIYLDRLSLRAERLDRRRGGPARLWPADPRACAMIEAGHPVPDAAGLRSGRTRARARRRRGRRRSGAGADVGRRLGQLDRAGAGRLARGQAGGDARAAALGRRPSARSTRCASISRASRAGGSRATPIRRELVTIAISDVPGDDPSVIGSGPTVPDPTTLADARAIVANIALELPASVTRALADPRQ